MSLPFLNPWMLVGLAAVAIPVIIHLFNRNRVQSIDWAAMELLRKVIQVKSRQLRLQDILLMLLRCLAILLFVLAAARPTTHAPVKAVDTGVLIALDGSYSMGQRPGVESRMDRALARVREILGTVGPGRPVTFMLMGDHPRVLIRNAGYDAARFAEQLDKIQPLAEGLNLERALAEMNPLVQEIKSPQREVYLVTDGQATTWRNLSDATRHSLGELSALARVFVVAVEAGGQENLALVRFELASGALRMGTVARYVAHVRNQGTAPRDVGPVELLLDDALVDRQLVGRIAPGQTLSVPLYAALTHEGPARITARIGADELAVDNTRYAVAQVRRSVRVLLVDGETADKPFGSATDFLTAAISPRHAQRSDASVEITARSWLGLTGVHLSEYDLIVLANVPDVPEEKVEALSEFVRRGGGLIVFVGDNVNADALNKRLARNGTALLPAELGMVNSDTSINAAGLPLDPALPDEALVAPLASLPVDLLTECRFVKWMKVHPLPQSRVLLKLAASGDPILVESQCGRGKVLLFTSTADRKWNNMAINPLFPVLLQQATTFLTRVPAERALAVNEPLVLPLPADMAGATAKVIDPAGQTHNVVASLHDGEVSAQWEDTGLPGFYKVLTGADPQGVALAINVDPAESDIHTLPTADLTAALVGTQAKVMGGSQSVLSAVQESRVGRELWYFLAIGALIAMLVEGLLARWQTKQSTARVVQRRSLWNATGKESSGTTSE